MKALITITLLLISLNTYSNEMYVRNDTIELHLFSPEQEYNLYYINQADTIDFGLVRLNPGENFLTFISKQDYIEVINFWADQKLIFKNGEIINN